MQIFNGNRTDNWETCPKLFETLHKLYDLRWDLASSDQNKKCENYFDLEDDALAQPWDDLPMAWLNPPFSRAHEFFTKCAKSLNPIVAIYKTTNLETKLWQDLILPSAAWVCFLRGRTQYINEESHKPNKVPFGSALIGFRVPQRVAHLGKVWDLGAR